MTSHDKKQVRFYFDFLSPYAYLGWVELLAFAKNPPVPIAVEPIPVLFSALLKHWGNKGPAYIQPKRTFVFKDVLRRAQQIDLELNLPARHPFNPLLPLRLLVNLEDSPRRNSIITSVFEACWGRGLDITDPQVLQPILQAHGLHESKHPTLATSTDQAIKDKLRQNTDEAIERGVFGVPTYGIDNELFWGSDQIPFLKDFLLGQDPIQLNQ